MNKKLLLLPILCLSLNIFASEVEKETKEAFENFKQTKKLKVLIRTMKHNDPQAYIKACILLDKIKSLQIVIDNCKIFDENYFEKQEELNQMIDILDKLLEDFFAKR